MKKRIVSIVLALCLILGAVPVKGLAASGPEIVDSGVCGENLTWTLDSNGLLTISGTGDMDNFFEPPWYTQEVHSVAIEEGITSIGSYAFYGCKKIKEIKISQTVKFISTYKTFYDCISLATIAVDSKNSYYTDVDGVLYTKDMETLLLYPQAKSNTNYVIPIGVKTIGQSAFYKCNNLTQVVYPQGIQEIGSNNFYGCSNLAEVDFPESLTYIGEDAFSYCTSLKSVVLPKGIESVDGFSYCTNLTSLVLNIVEDGYIGDSAFPGLNNLKSLILPITLKRIGAYSFKDSKSLKDIYYAGTEAQWNRITVRNGNDWINRATIHFNSTGPSDIEQPTSSPSPELGEITLRTDKDTLLIGEELPITASVRTPSGFTESDITWSSSDENIATVTPTGALVGDYTSATATITGISEGTVTITATMADGRSASCTVKVALSSGLLLEDFEESIYRADMLLEREDTPIKGIYSDVKKGKSPCQVFFSEMRNDYSLMNSVAAWNALNDTLSAISGPSSIHDYAFKEKDFYTALILDVLQASVSDLQKSSVEKTMDVMKDWSDEVVSFVKLKYTDFRHLTSEEKEQLKKEISERLQAKIVDVTWDTDHKYLGIFNKIMEAYGEAEKIYHNVEDFMEYIVSSYALLSMSDSLKAVVKELYANSGSTPALNEALKDIVRLMETSEQDFFDTMVTDGLSIAGEKIADKLVDKFWDKTILSLSPEVKFILDVYKTEKWLINKLGGVDTIAEECNKIIMLATFENVVSRTESTLAGKYKGEKNVANAAAFLSCVDIQFATWDESCKAGLSFAKSIDSGLMTKPIAPGLLAKLVDAFTSASVDNKKKIKDAIVSIQSSYEQTNDSLWNGWINNLDSDYPNSGLYESYKKFLRVTRPLPQWPLKKKIMISCPVDIKVYDTANQVIASTDGSQASCSGSLTVAVVGDEKTLYFYDDADYRLECVGTDTGKMDVSIEEFDTNQVKIRNVAFKSIPLTIGKVYEAEIDRGVLDGSEYSFVSTDGATIEPDEDTWEAKGPADFLVSFVPNGGTGTMASIEVKGANTITLPECGFSAPSGKKFAGWLVNGSKYTPGMTVQIAADTVVSAIWEVEAQLPIEIKLPFADVPENAWYLAGVKYVYQHGLMVGTSSNNFSPNGTTTRGQIVTILYRMEREPNINATGTFSDVPTGKWYSKAVEWAAKNEIVKGYGGGKFGPEDNITREQMVSILYRYAKYKGFHLSKTTSLSEYSDLAKVSSYAVEPMRWAVAEGVISGLPGKKLGPTAKTNRAEVAVILKRFCENIDI